MFILFRNSVHNFVQGMLERAFYNYAAHRMDFIVPNYYSLDEDEELRLTEIDKPLYLKRVLLSSCITKISHFIESFQFSANVDDNMAYNLFLNGTCYYFSFSSNLSTALIY